MIIYSQGKCLLGSDWCFELRSKRTIRPHNIPIVTESGPLCQVHKKYQMSVFLNISCIFIRNLMWLVLGEILTKAVQRPEIYISPKHQTGSWIVFLSLHWLTVKIALILVYGMTINFWFCFFRVILIPQGGLESYFMGVISQSQHTNLWLHLLIIITAKWCLYQAACGSQDNYCSLLSIPRVVVLLVCLFCLVPVNRS